MLIIGYHDLYVHYTVKNNSKTLQNAMHHLRYITIQQFGYDEYNNNAEL